jgi:hypothetical protein
MLDIILFGVDIPLWIVFIIALIVIFLAWKIIKFAIKILLIIALFFIILIVLDYTNVFNTIQNLISGII